MPCPFSAFATNYDDCASSCFGYYTECDIGACISHCEELFLTGEGEGDGSTDKCANVQCYDPYCDGNELVTCDCDETTGGCVCTAFWCAQGCDPATLQCEDIPTDLCANVQCYDPYCDGNQLVTCDCDETTGQCVCSAFWCAQGCDPATAQCIEKEINTVPAIIEILDYPGYVILQDRGELNKLDLGVKATYLNGTPATGARVHVRFTDPKHTGVLGPWGFRDTVFFIESDGYYYGDLEFPTLRNIKEYHWDEFPYYVQIDVTVSMHDNSNDWSATKSSQIELRSPAPRILQISINPTPAQAAEKHQVRVVVDDPDSTELTYVFTNFGGKWTTPHTGAIKGSTDRVSAFTSSNQNEVLEWEAPPRGFTHNNNELTYAVNLANIIIDTFTVGPTEAMHNADAALEKIPEGEAMSDKMSVVIVVMDSDGFYDKEYYSFPMEYLGLKPEGGG